MAHGGIILIDTRDGGSGEGFAAGAGDALRQFGHELAMPPLAPLTSAHVLARSFYLLQDFPGRFDGATVWVQRDQDPQQRQRQPGHHRRAMTGPPPGRSMRRAATRSPPSPAARGSARWPIVSASTW